MKSKRFLYGNRAVAVVTLIAAILMPIAVASAGSTFLTFTFTAEVVGMDSVPGTAPALATLGDGDLISGYFTFDLSVPDSGPASIGDYEHGASPASIYAAWNDVVFRSILSSEGTVSVDVSVFNSLSDYYSIQSDNNVANMGVPAPTALDFALEDMTGTALASDAQPTSAFDLTDFDPYSLTGTRLLIAGGDYMIAAEITSIESNLVVAEDGFATLDDCDAPTAVCFSSIQDAIDALAMGDTVSVCPGTYAEDIEFPIGKDDMSLMALDPAPTNTVIKGQANSAAANFPLAVPNVHVLANGVTISGFTVQGPDPMAGFYSSGTVVGGDDTTLDGNIFEVTNASNFSEISQGIQTYRDANNPTGGNVDGLVISNNQFVEHGPGDAGYEAIFINHVSSDPTPVGMTTISGNQFSGKLLRGVTCERSNVDITDNIFSTELMPAGPSLDVGESLQAVNLLDFGDRDQQDVNVLGNTIGTGVLPLPSGAFSQGVRVGSGAQLLSNINIENNAINGNGTGVLIRSSADGVKIFDNDLSGNLDLGADNLDIVDADAGGNWWGDFDAVAVAAQTGATVDYTPWLAVDTDIDGANGFQGDFTTLYVDDDSPQVGPTGRIQEGIDLVTASTVHVLPGTYIEQVYVYKSVNLLGANVGIDPNGGGRGLESVVLVDESGPDPSTAPYPTHFYLDANDIVIDGFTLDGDNPMLASGELLNGADLDAIEAIASYEGVGGITVQNNIIRNTSYTGIDLYNYSNSGGATSNNFIRNNLIENLGAFNWGIGVLIYNNFYAEITDNVINDVRVGIQTGNFYQANPGTTASIVDNDIAARRVGIFYNLHYSDASLFDVNSNDISGVNDLSAPMDARWFGMLISSQQSAVDANFVGNEIDGAAIVDYLSAGIVAWNTPTSSELRIEGGSVTGVDYGVWVNNYEGYNSDAMNTSLAVDGLSITAGEIGVYVLDSPLNTNNSSVAALIENNTEVTGATIAGVLVEGTDAAATVKNNLGSIVGNEVGIMVDAATALIERTNISGNSQAGLVVTNDGVVDAGDVADGNVTGLGTGSGAMNGSSIGCNFLAGYDAVNSFAVINENLDASLNVNVLAEMNFWGTEDPGEIEDVVIHTADDSLLTQVLTTDPKTVPQIIISAPEMCQNNNPTQVSVTASIANLPLSVHGYFATITYDTAVLQYNESESSYTMASEVVFPLHLSGFPQPHEDTIGLVQIEAARPIVPPNPGTDQDTDVATLVFDVVGCGKTAINILPADGPFESEVSFEGIGLTTELIGDTVLIDTGDAPMVIADSASAAALDDFCSTSAMFSTTIEDDCCLVLADGATVDVVANVSAGDADLGTLSFTAVQGVNDRQLVVTGAIPATLASGCSATIQFTITGSDCCGNALVPTMVMTDITDDVDPVFVNTPGSLDISIECDESTVPGILLGVTAPSSGVAIYYNDNGDGEDGLTNVAYMRAQASATNINAAPFIFDNTALTGNGLLNWAGLFGQVSPTQHGIDLVLPAPTLDGSVIPPALTAYDNTDNSIAGRLAAGQVTWAINDYKGGSPNGPANPATQIINSLLRSAMPANPATDVQDLQIDLTQAGPIFTADISGRLVNDGSIHWYTPSTPDSPVGNFALTNDIFFFGSLTYDSTGDSGTDLVDFYDGSMTLTANSPNIALGFPLVTDNCTLFPALTYADVVTPGTDCEIDQIVETIERTWTATDDCGNEASFTQIITVVDTTPPVIVQPADIVTNSDAGGCDAFVTVPPLSVSDNCSGFTITNDRTGTADASDTYPAGSPTTITWTVTDDCGNDSQVMQTITVEATNTINVVVVLPNLTHQGSGDTPLNFVRPIHFTLMDVSGCETPFCELVEFDGLAGETPVANVALTVPCGDWAAICAKDNQLTLNSSTSLQIIGSDYSGLDDLELRSGDTDNDGDVDINDVTFLLFSYSSVSSNAATCPPMGMEAPRSADFSLNGLAFTEDFTILQANWLAFTSCGCPTTGIIANSPAFEEVDVVRELDRNRRALRLGVGARRNVVLRARADAFDPAIASAIDLNRDGFIDHEDVSAFEDAFGLTKELSRKIRHSTSQLDATSASEVNIHEGTNATGGVIRR